MAKDSGRIENCTRERGEIVDRIGELAIVELRRAPVTLAHTGPRPGVLGSPTPFSDPSKKRFYVAFLNDYSERVLPGTDFLALRDKDIDVYRTELRITSGILRDLNDTASRGTSGAIKQRGRTISVCWSWTTPRRPYCASR